MSGTRWMLVGFGLLTAPLSAQELPFRAPASGEVQEICGGPTEGAGDRADAERGSAGDASAADRAPTDEARAQAIDLLRHADRAVILGELDRALSFLDRATELDRTSADAAYRRARVLEDMGDIPSAVEAYCQAATRAEARGERSDARERASSLADVAALSGVPSSASEALARGLRAAEDDRFEEALEEIDAALLAAPRWPAALYNRGVALSRLGRNREAALELRRYLQEAPAASDGVEVARRIGQLEVMAERRVPGARTAFTLGMLFPGLGQFYSGRVVEGFTVFTLAAGAAAVGYFITEVHVRCLESVEPGERCPPDLVASRRERRPHLVPALGIAGGFLALGAVEALLRARGAASEQGSSLSGAAREGRVLSGPSLTARGSALELSFLTLHFR